jgi:hypothetical protein
MSPGASNIGVLACAATEYDPAEQTEKIVLLALLIACGGDPPAPAPQPQADAGSSSVAAALASLQEGNTPDPTPVDKEPPAVPEEVADRAPAEKTSSGGRSDSPECRAARAEREAHQEKIDRYRENDVIQAEQRWLWSQDAVAACAADLGGCATDGEKYQDHLVNEKHQLAAYEAAQFKLSELEAGFYEIDQSIAEACGTGR